MNTLDVWTCDGCRREVKADGTALAALKVDVHIARCLPHVKWEEPMRFNGRRVGVFCVAVALAWLLLLIVKVAS